MVKIKRTDFIQIYFDHFRSASNAKVLYCLDSDANIARTVFKERNMDSDGILVPFEMFDFILRDKSLQGNFQYCGYIAAQMSGNC